MDHRKMLDALLDEYKRVCVENERLKQTIRELEQVLFGDADEE